MTSSLALLLTSIARAVQSWRCQDFPDQFPGALCRHESSLPLPYRIQAKAVMPPQKESDAVLEGHCRSVLICSCMPHTKHCNRANS